MSTGIFLFISRVNQGPTQRWALFSSGVELQRQGWPHWHPSLWLSHSAALGPVSQSRFPPQSKPAGLLWRFPEQCTGLCPRGLQWRLKQGLNKVAVLGWVCLWAPSRWLNSITLVLFFCSLWGLNTFQSLSIPFQSEWHSQCQPHLVLNKSKCVWCPAAFPTSVKIRKIDLPQFLCGQRDV